MQKKIQFVCTFFFLFCNPCVTWKAKCIVEKKCLTYTYKASPNSHKICIKLFCKFHSILYFLTLTLFISRFPILAILRNFFFFFFFSFVTCICTSTNKPQKQNPHNTTQAASPTKHTHKQYNTNHGIIPLC